MREIDFQKGILDALNTSRGLWWRQNAGLAIIKGKRSGRAFQGAPEGAADIAGIVNGHHVEVEVKVKAPHRPKQKEWEEKVHRAGGIYVLVRYDPKLTRWENIDRALQLVDQALADQGL